jgi:hypothetical protein
MFLDCSYKRSKILKLLHLNENYMTIWIDLDTFGPKRLAIAVIDADVYYFACEACSRFIDIEAGAEGSDSEGSLEGDGAIGTSGSLSSTG